MTSAARQRAIERYARDPMRVWEYSVGLMATTLIGMAAGLMIHSRLYERSGAVLGIARVGVIRVFVPWTPGLRGIDAERWAYLQHKVANVVKGYVGPAVEVECPCRACLPRAWCQKHDDCAADRGLGEECWQMSRPAVWWWREDERAFREGMRSRR